LPTLRGRQLFTVPILTLLSLPVTGEELRPPAEPSPAEQQNLLSSIRQYAEQYVENLPNFICEQVTRQFEAGKKPKRWRQGDTLTARLIYNGGREERTLEYVNNRPVGTRAQIWRRPLITEGEFGMLMERVFNSLPDTGFSWSGWQSGGSGWLAAFDYEVDKQHSTLSLTLGDLAKAVVPYRGSIYADPATGAIWRITSNPTDIPAELRTKSISTLIDYAPVAIGGKSYILPFQATVTLVTPSGNIKNEIEFTGFRKFETESRITYSPGATSPK
jgi:hypothetical protein